MTNFTDYIGPFTTIVSYVLYAALAVVLSLGTIHCVVLGVKYAKAEEAQDRDKAKGALRNAIVGYLLIFVLIAVLTLIHPQLVGWLEGYLNGTTTK